MSYIAAEDIAKAKEMDLLTYLRNYESQELVHVSGNTYCTREHDSLRISNGNIAIYQIDPDRDENNVTFLNYENLERFQGSAALRSEIYDKVFEGEVECGTLEEVYQMFSLDQGDPRLDYGA